MEIIILVCSFVNIVMLAVILFTLTKISQKNTSSGNQQEIEELKKQIEFLSKNNENYNKILMDDSARQSESITKQISVLGDSLRSSINSQQEKQHNDVNEKLTKLENDFNNVRESIIASLENIRRSNDESMVKMRTENQESLDRVNNTVDVKLQKMLNEKLTKLENDFNNVKESIIASLENIRRSNDESMEKMRAENQESLNKINNTVDEKLQKMLIEKLTKLENDFDNIKESINTKLENIRRSNNESMEKMRTENQESLDRINNTVNEKLQKSLDDKISKSFEAVNKRLAEVYEGLGEMKNVASGVSDLKNVLSNVKTRGIMGEIQLGAILNEILSNEQYAEQVAVKPQSSQKVDFAVKLPGAENGECIYLPIDSKFPGDTYSNLLDAYESGNPALLKEKRSTLVTEIKRCAKSIHDKYICPPYTTDFAIMFLPFEGLYAEVVNLGLVEILQREYRINIAGPSTMGAMLNSLQMGFRTLAVQKKSNEVWKILESAKKEFGKFEDVLTKTRDRLRQADEELSTLIGTRTNTINKALKNVSLIDSESEQ